MSYSGNTGRFVSLLPFRRSVMLIAFALRNHIPFSRVHRLSIWLFQLLIAGPFIFIEGILFNSAIRKHEPKHPPIFIIGHWRSGTTFLQELLAKDKRFGTMNIYEGLFPECFMTTKFFFKPLIQFIGTISGAKNKWHRRPFDLNIPAEEDLALQSAYSFDSLYWGHVFPKNYGSFLEKNIDPKKNEFAMIMHDWKLLVKKLSFSKNKQLIIKNPSNTYRIQHIISVFPDAKFVFIHRDPYDVFQSTCDLWQCNRGFLLQNFKPEKYFQMVADSQRLMHEHYMETKHLIPHGSLIEIPFEEMTKDPIKLVKNIVTKFSSHSFDPALFEPMIGRNPFVKRNYRHAREVIETVNWNMQDYLEYFGYSEKTS